jgi:hypothetical protein
MTGQSKHQAWPDKQYSGQAELFEEYLATGEQMRVADDLFFRRWQALATTQMAAYLKCMKTSCEREVTSAPVHGLQTFAA